MCLIEKDEIYANDKKILEILIKLYSRKNNHQKN